jgi:heme/copper-type cytochrome/quinol oxidase subunit 2
MRKTTNFIFIVSLAILSTSFIAKTQNSPAADTPHVIEMTAKAYEFTPSEIHVTKGERVHIKLRTTDRAHGLTLNLYPEGASEDGNAGLLFERPQDTAKVETGKDRIIEFVAVRPGAYVFKCSVKCSMFGNGHDRMTGKLVVEE